MTTDPYWWQAAVPLSTETRPLPSEVEVVVVGSGYTGLSAALTLARGGREVLVLDRARVGEGASTRNAGMMSGNLKLSLGALVGRYGAAAARAIYEEGVEARAYIHALIEAEKIECARAPTGLLTPATNPKHYEKLAREAEILQRTLRLSTYALPQNEQSSEIGSDVFFGGVINDEVWSFHPGLYHQGLLQRTLAAGAAVQDMTEVSRIVHTDSKLLVTTPSGSIAADAVVVATNGYTTPGLPWWRHRVIPIRGRIAATVPIGNNLMKELLPKGRLVVESNRLFHYFRPSPDGTRMLVGGRYGGSERHPQNGLKRFRRRLAEVFPALVEIEFEHDWQGFTAFTRDLLPHIGVHDGVHYAMGFCGSGTVWGTWLGRKIGLKILQSKDASTAFDRTLPGIPLYSGRPWFLPPVMGWFAFRDKLDNLSSKF